MNNRIAFREFEEMKKILSEKEVHERDIQFIYNSNKSIKELFEEIYEDIK